MDEPLWQAGQVSRRWWPLLKPWMVWMGFVAIGLQIICLVSLQLEVHRMRTALPYAAKTLRAALDEDRSEVSRVEKGLQTLRVALGESRNDVRQLNLSKASQAQLHVLQAAMDEHRSAQNTTADSILQEIGRMQSMLTLADEATLTPFQGHRPGSVSLVPGLIEYASVRQGANVSATPPCLIPSMTQNAILPFDQKVRAGDGDFWFMFMDADTLEQVLLLDLGDVRPLHRVGAILRTPGPGGQYTDRMTWQRFDVRGWVTKENILHLGTMSEKDLLQLNTSSTDWKAVAMFTVGGVRARFVRYSFGRTPSSGSYGSNALQLLSNVPYGSRVLQLFAQGPEL